MVLGHPACVSSAQHSSVVSFPDQLLGIPWALQNKVEMWNSQKLAASKFSKCRKGFHAKGENRWTQTKNIGRDRLRAGFCGPSRHAITAGGTYLAINFAQFFPTAPCSCYPIPLSEVQAAQGGVRAAVAQQRVLPTFPSICPGRPAGRPGFGFVGLLLAGKGGAQKSKVGQDDWVETI